MSIASAFLKSRENTSHISIFIDFEKLDVKIFIVS